ncbi:DMT family transporter [Luteimonas gilva]|uniref:DMT family transporter n=1 Tax=Luteimonas gilva TaxID=2572684 RepID=A0A4V5ZQB6_9GAMM|nr:DMT family transporter [Luteimonas gilva]TKR30533.1 DMT family transporter [Luteimonas gilva]
MTSTGAGHWLLAVAIGALLPLEALMNARLGQATRGPLFAAFVTCLGGAAALGMMLMIARPSSSPALQTAPFWLWCAGLLGATYLASATMLVPRLGVAGLICLVVLGQMLSSLLLDHYGVLNAPRPADALRAAGAALVAGGTLLVVQPWRAGP